jgi:phage portal protein BeeE
MSLRSDDDPRVRDWLRAAERGDAHALKAASPVPFTGGGSSGPVWWGSIAGGALPGLATLPGAKANFESRAGALHLNSVIAACLGWIVDNFGQATLRVATDVEGADPEPIPRHPMVAMLRRPNDYYSARVLWAATAMSRKLTGSAYWYKIRAGGNPRGVVTGVKWLDPSKVRPVFPAGPTDVYIAGYEALSGTDWRPIPGGPEAVVHFRDGMAPTDERAGWRRMEAVLRQVSATNEGATYTATILENMGIPAVMLTHAEPGPIEENDAQAALEAFQRDTGGGNRGRAFLPTIPLIPHVLGGGPQDMALDTILERPTAEICALMGIPPMVLGLPDSGRTYENYAVAIRAAYENCLIPLQDSIADDLRHQLLPDFGDPDAQLVEWDRSRIKHLADDRSQDIVNAVTAFQGGLCPLATAQTLAGLEVTDGAEELWYAAATMTDDPAAPPEPAPMPMPMPNDPNAGPNAADIGGRDETGTDA